MKDNAKFYFDGYCLQLVHATSGRIRLKAIAPTENTLNHLTVYLEQLDGVYEVKSKHQTGSVIIWFNAYHLKGEEIITYLMRSPEFACSETKEKQVSWQTISIRAETIAFPAAGVVRVGVLKGLKGGVLKSCLAVFAHYSLEELAQHSRQERENSLPSSLPKKSAWQRLKAIAR
ncbi:MAG: hypothetical protein J7647_30215 [Cyanobacteria bacterium SBLK]|nr:hypothetical protein [Cyanobacteria bacterium SBLK]